MKNEDEHTESAPEPEEESQDFLRSVPNESPEPQDQTPETDSEPPSAEKPVEPHPVEEGHTEETLETEESAEPPTPQKRSSVRAVILFLLLIAGAVIAFIRFGGEEFLQNVGFLPKPPATQTSKALPQHQPEPPAPTPPPAAFPVEEVPDDQTAEPSIEESVAFKEPVEESAPEETPSPPEGHISGLVSPPTEKAVKPVPFHVSGADVSEEAVFAEEEGASRETVEDQPREAEETARIPGFEETMEEKQTHFEVESIPPAEEEQPATVERNKETQAYLDFIESSGRTIAEWIQSVYGIVRDYILDQWRSSTSNKAPSKAG